MKITLREALDAYRVECESRGQSESHVRTTFVYLRKLQAAVEAQARTKGRKDAADPRLSALTPECVSALFAGMKGLGEGSRNKALLALRNFMAFLVRRKYLTGDSAEMLTGDRKFKTDTRKPKHYIPVEQFGDMLDLAGRRHGSDRAALALALYTLARQAEITGLRLRDIDLDNWTVRIYRGKQRRWTDVTICPDLQGELLNWLDAYAKETGSWGARQMMADHPDWHVVPHVVLVRNGGVYQTSLFSYTLDPERPSGRLWDVVKGALDVLGSTTEDGKFARHKGEGMHTIRRSGARAMLDYLADDLGSDKALLQVSIMLDHNDPKTTLLYIGRDIERDRLNDYLKTGSMYGPAHRAAKPAGNVIQLRQQAG